MYTEKELIDKAVKEYKNGTASYELNKNDCVLLVIDMQNEFVKPDWTSSWIPEATRQVPKIKQLIDVCRRNNIPVIYTVFSKTHQYFDRPKYGYAMPNRFAELETDEEWFSKGEIYKELTPNNDEIVIHKCSYGAFYDTPLETILKNLEKNTIIISGTLTNCCCGTTARQGYERGYKVIFGSDITSTYTQEMQDSELDILRFAFAKILSSDEIIHELEKASSNRMNHEVVNFKHKLGLFKEQWSPKVIAEMNDYQFKVVKIQGEFVWHDHKDTDETFIVLEGSLRIDFRDGQVNLSEGEMYVVPRGIEHKPYAEKEVKVLLVEPRGVVNTGDAVGSHTAENDVWI